MTLTERIMTLEGLPDMGNRNVGDTVVLSPVTMPVGSGFLNPSFFHDGYDFWLTSGAPNADTSGYFRWASGETIPRDRDDYDLVLANGNIVYDPVEDRLVILRIDTSSYRGYIAPLINGVKGADVDLDGGAVPGCKLMAGDGYLWVVGTDRFWRINPSDFYDQTTVTGFAIAMNGNASCFDPDTSRYGDGEGRLFIADSTTIRRYIPSSLVEDDSWMCSDTPYYLYVDSTTGRLWAIIGSPMWIASFDGYALGDNERWIDLYTWQTPGLVTINMTDTQFFGFSDGYGYFGGPSSVFGSMMVRLEDPGVGSDLVVGEYWTSPLLPTGGRAYVAAWYGPYTPPSGVILGGRLYVSGFYSEYSKQVTVMSFGVPGFTGPQEEINSTLPEWETSGSPQVIWYVNGSTGSDTNPGTETEPLLTTTEFCNRIKNSKQQIILHLDNIWNTIIDIPDASHVTIQGSVGAPALIGKVASYSNNVLQATDMDDVPIDWNLYSPGQFARIVFTTNGSGDPINTAAYLLVIDPDGVSSDYALITTPIWFDEEASLWDVYVPTVGDVFQYEALTSSISSLKTNPSDGVWIKDVAIGYLAATLPNTPANYAIRNSWMHRCFIFRSGPFASINVNSSLASESSVMEFQVINCRSQTITLASGPLYFYGGYARLEYSGNSNLKISNVMLEDFILDGSGSNVYLTDDNVLYHNEMSIYGPCTMRITGTLSGNTYEVNQNYALSIQSNNVVVTWIDTAPPTVIGNIADVRIIPPQVGSNFDFRFIWADCVFRSDEQKGIGTFVDGYATVSARNSDARGVLISYATTSNPGIISVPVANRTSTEFEAVSTSNTDDSTFDWYIPPVAGLNIIVAPAETLGANVPPR